MVDAFSIVGADPDFAKMHVTDMVQVDSQKPTTFMEIYGGGAICHEANRSRRSLSVEGIAALDLRTCKDDGTRWNFCNRKDRRLAREMVDKEEPMWLIGSPPCTAFCQWNVARNDPKSKDREAVKKAIDEGRRHLNFMVSLYRKQLHAGRHFLHEHPATAAS